jgi:Protein of unknown function (DUF2971)
VKTIDALEKLVRGFLQDQTASPPDILWHYTNAAGFLGIFRSGRLWATNTDYLNDASEMRYARHLVLRGVNSVRSSAENREEHEMLNLLCECIGSNVTRPVFVTSLSAEKNDLSQWRAYGGSSGSFALGFNSERLVAAIAKNTDTRFNLYKCIYDEVHSASLCQQFVESLFQEFRVHRHAHIAGGSDYQETLDLVHEAVRIFDTLAPLIKHPDFLRESEWRLVSDPVDLTKRPIRLREGRTRIVSYLELTIAKDKSDPKFTVHTLIGPAISYSPRDINLAQIGYCDDFILQPFPVEPSTTPYRQG